MMQITCERIDGLSDILFDLDGTLTDPGKGITRCIQYALEKLGKVPEPEERLLACIGPPLRDSFALLLQTTDKALLDRALFFYRERFSASGIFENVLYPDIVPALRTVTSGGFRIHLATSKPRVYAERILAHFGLRHFFTTVHGSELDGRLTDKGELIAHVLESENLYPNRTMMVGDRSHDINGGKKNGLSTAAVTYGFGSDEEIAAARPDFIFHSPVGLASFLVPIKGCEKTSIAQIG
jgi:phosphoglycolate phosphatase